MQFSVRKYFLPAGLLIEETYHGKEDRQTPHTCYSLIQIQVSTDRHSSRLGSLRRSDLWLSGWPFTSSPLLLLDR
ncbi:hypothetical protein RHMOL_Rhmol06G0009600 [Rhododendron molle]|uniref:Uncharacterized protein n=2 Tax=Rhododendron molle TaxID=49168 RepID=A0ACC0N9A9_RHOML|nr:hypothetical protein RHMOL_Rhmol06G0009600 [Rhododendron molle]KAI8549224.1 hypothetical protein RHMOL_Rhmol06G0009600 [Rhododendron molle]